MTVSLSPANAATVRQNAGVEGHRARPASLISPKTKIPDRGDSEYFWAVAPAAARASLMILRAVDPQLLGDQSFPRVVYRRKGQDDPRRSIDIPGAERVEVTNAFRGITAPTPQVSDPTQRPPQNSMTRDIAAREVPVRAFGWEMKEAINNHLAVYGVRLECFDVYPARDAGVLRNFIDAIVQPTSTPVSRFARELAERLAPDIANGMMAKTGHPYAESIGNYSGVGLVDLGSLRELTGSKTLDPGEALGICRSLNQIFAKGVPFEDRFRVVNVVATAEGRLQAVLQDPFDTTDQVG